MSYIDSQGIGHWFRIGLRIRHPTLICSNCDSSTRNQGHITMSDFAGVSLEVKHYQLIYLTISVLQLCCAVTTAYCCAVTTAYCCAVTTAYCVPSNFVRNLTASFRFKISATQFNCSHRNTLMTILKIYSDRQLKFWLGLVSDYSKHIAIGSFHVRSTSVLQWPPPICFKFGMFVDI